MAVTLSWEREDEHAEARVMSVRVAHRANSDKPFTVKIDDEGAGEFVTIVDDDRDARVSIDPEEWPMLRSVIDDMIAKCRP